MDDHLKQLLHPSGELRFGGIGGVWYDNRQNGGGMIECSRPPLRGIDANLFGVQKVMVDALKLHVVINSVDTGQHVENSRHLAHLAADMNRIAPVELPLRVMTLGNPRAVELLNWLLAHGFKIGEGVTNPGPGVLFGPVHSHFNPSDLDHSTHLHMSLGRH